VSKSVAYADVGTLVGQEIGVSDWVQVTQERVNQFAEATGDHQWIHVDVERATREIGGPIAHGYLTLSLIPFLGAGLLNVSGVTRGINYGSNKVRFTGMVHSLVSCIPPDLGSAARSFWRMRTRLPTRTMPVKRTLLEP
jgi:acyl dehydratase